MRGSAPRAPAPRRFPARRPSARTASFAPIAGCASSTSFFSSSDSVAATPRARPSGSSSAASRSTKRVRPSNSSASSSTLSCRGKSRMRTRRRAAGRDGGRRRARPRARPGGRTARRAGRRSGTCRASAVGELADAAVGVGLARADELVAAPELDRDAGCGLPAFGVEHVRRDRHRHSLAASLRCSRAISSSRARTRLPPATTFSPPT